MELVILILILLFPAGLLLVFLSNSFEKFIPDPIGGYMTLAGVGMIWGPIVAGVPFILYEFVVRGIAFYLGLELPSLLNE